MTEFENAGFWDYIITDEMGTLTGVRDDIPESLRAEYKAFLEEQEYARRHNMKI